MRLGLGPVFWCELVTASRRWQPFALRVLLLTTLLGSLAIAYANTRYGPRSVAGNLSLQDYASLGEAFAGTLICTQLAIVLLSAPAATAGAICLDKSRGNLLLLLNTELSGPEIVLGKLAARLWPVLALVASSLPLLFIVTLMGGVSPRMLVVGFAVIAATAVFTCSLAFVISMYVGKTYESLLLSYFLVAAWLISYPMADICNLPQVVVEFAKALNPFVAVFAPTKSDYSPVMTALFLAGALVLTTLFVGWAAWRVRRVTIRQASRGSWHRRMRWNWRNRMRGLSRSPLHWYERHRRRPSLAARIVWLAYAGIACSLTAWALVVLFAESRIGDPVAFAMLFQVGLGLLLATVTGIAGFAEERAHGSWDVLLSTPVSSKAIVNAKWWAVYRLFVRVSLLPIVLFIIFGVTYGFRTGTWHYPSDYRWMEVGLYQLGGIVYLLLVGSLYASLSVALATRFRRLAVGATAGVTILVLHCIGTLIVAILVRDECYLALSPLAAPILISETALRTWSTSDTVLVGFLLGTCLAYGVVATAAYWWIRWRFDALIGRVPENGRKRRKPSSARLPQDVALPAVVGGAGEHEQQIGQSI